MTKAIKRSEVIHVRLTADERARFTERCAPDDLPISEAIRRVMREAAELGPSFDGEVADEIRGLTPCLPRQLHDLRQPLPPRIRRRHRSRRPGSL